LESRQNRVVYSFFIKRVSLKTFLLNISLFLLGGFLQGVPCYAALVVPPTDLYLSTRSLGMGDASVAVADSEDAILQNPAGIGFADRRHKDSNSPQSALFPNITAATNGFTFDQIQQYFDSSASNQAQTAQDNILNAAAGDIVYARASLFPTVVWRHVQFGVLLDSQVSGYTTDYDTPQISTFDSSQTYNKTFTLFTSSQAGAVLGSSIPLTKQGLTIGFSTRWAVRASSLSILEANNDELLQDSVDNANNNINQTYGAALDLGIIMPIPRMSYFKLAAAVQNVGDATYSPMSSSDENEVDKMAVNMGMSFNPTLARGVGVIFSFEENRINDPRILFRDKMRIGSELSLGSYTGRDAPLSLRGGYDMRSWSAGASLDVIFARLDVATYGEVVNTSNGYIVDRRFAAKMTVELVD
jgi:hypothetical protein